MAKRYLGLAKELVSNRALLGADVTCPVSSTTPFLTFTVPANSVAVGDTFELFAFIVNGATTTTSYTLSLAVGAASPGATQVWATAALNANTSASGMWARGILTVKSIGAAGTVMGGGVLEANGSAVINVQTVSNTNATQVVDTTAPWFITARLLLGAGVATVVKSGVIQRVT